MRAFFRKGSIDSGGELMILNKIKEFIGRFRFESFIVLVSLLTFAIALFTLFPKLGNPLYVLIIAFSTIIIMLLYALLFNLKRLIRERFEKIDAMFKEYKTRFESLDLLLKDYFGFSWIENQYFKRLRHFLDEKKSLARILVNEILPNLIKKICNNSPNLCEINIILDSGTTITPIFPNLIKAGIPTKREVKFNFFTNNLAGIDEIHKMDTSGKDALTERDFNLIGGQPLNKYRATTGELTQRILEDIWENQKRSNNETISVGIITANWIIGGVGLESLQICARGTGHFEFKVSIIKNCQYIILVAPLGKILPVSSVDELNVFISDDYRAYKIPVDKRNTTYLLTSYRSTHSISPLLRISDRLKNIKERNKSQNFIFCDENPVFDPINNREEVRLIDLPHDYIRENFKKVYGYPMP